MLHTNLPLHGLSLLRILAAAPIIVLAGWAAFHDILHRKIPNKVVLQILCIGIVVRVVSIFLLHLSIVQILAAFLWPLALLGILMIGWQAGLTGGGDIKLWAALAMLVPATTAQQADFTLGVLVCGGVLSTLYLALRVWVRRGRAVLPAPCGAFLPRRIAQIEKWRSRHNIGTPYGTAIAASAIATTLFAPILHGSLLSWSSF